MKNQSDAQWFVTTPEATLRAESVLVAFHEGRTEDIAQTLVSQGENDAVALLVALIVVADRLADYGSALAEPTHRELLRDAARTVAEAVYNMEGN
jgi:hypothetical protein